MEKAASKIKILISAEQIQERVSELGRKITDYYKNKVFEDKPLVVIIVQKGASIFGADLVRKIKLPLDLRFMRVAGSEIFDKIESGIGSDHVLVVEDILDTGKTLSFIRDYLTKLRPESLSFAVLLIKRVKRKVKVPQIRFKAFDVPNKFIVGYGLDYNEIHRNLPYIGIVEN